MGNEMGNNNTSELREEEKAKAEDPEKSLLFRQKEASDDADRVNGDHHVTEKEEEKNEACNTAEFQVVSDRTKEDNEVQAKSKEDKGMEFDLEENQLDGNEHEHGKKASNQKEEEGERGSNLNTTILALHEKKLEMSKEDNEVQAKSKEDKEMEFDTEENRSDGNEHEHEKQASNPKEEEGKRGSNLNTTIFALHESKLEKTKEDNEVHAKSKEDKEMEFNSEENRLDGNKHKHEKQASNQKEEERQRSSNLNTTILALHESKLEKTKEDNEVHAKSKEDKEMEFDSKQNKSDGNEHKYEKQASNQKEEEGERGSNLNTTILALHEPQLEKTKDFKSNQDELVDIKVESLAEDSNKSLEECKDALALSLNNTCHLAYCAIADSEETTNMDQVVDTDRDTNKDNDGKGKSSNFDMITQASGDPQDEKTSDCDIDRDTDKENDAERGRCSNFNTITHASKDPKSENTSNFKSIQHVSLETRAELLSGSSDDDSSKESKYDVGFSLKRTKDNGDLIEPRSYHEYTMPTAKNVDNKDEESATNLICHNSLRSPPKESLVIESPKPSMHVPEVADRCTVLKEESQLREEHLGNETVVQDKIPTQSKILNGVEEEFNTIGSHSENNAEETEVSPELVAKNKNQNEDPGEDCQDSDGEYLEIFEQGMHILNLSVGDCKHKNEEMGETMKISTNNGHEVERQELEESPFEPVLAFQPQFHQKETSITFQTAESTDESISAPRQETATAAEKSKKNSSDSPSYIQTASSALTETETKPLTNPIDVQSVTRIPFSTIRGEDQESPGRTSNESNSDNSIGHIEMRKSPSFNIDIQSEGKAEETEKIPLLYQIKTMEDLANLQEISFPNPMEKRVVKLGRSDSEKSRPSFPGFAKEKEESEMESKSIDKNNVAADKKATKELPPASPIRKGKRRTKSLIFGTCICCATAIN